MTICLLAERFIDKKNKPIGIFDLGNHILIIGMVLICDIRFNKCRIGPSYLNSRLPNMIRKKTVSARFK